MLEKFNTMKSSDLEKINQENKDIWDENSVFWDNKIGNGNSFQEQLIEPYTEKLIDYQNDKNVLDIACGAGRFTRKMVEKGLTVTGIDFSAKFIEIAKNKSKPNSDKLQYYVVDVTDEYQLLKLGENKFDLATCSMAIMDIPKIEPLIKSLKTLLKDNGKFIFSILHPCFNSSNIQKFSEEHVINERYDIKNGVKVYSYKTSIYYKSEGIPEQPKSQYYFHRSQSELFNIFFKYGFVINGFEEPSFNNPNKDKDNLNWENMPEIPPVLVIRMMLIAKGN